jgi:hypothetical protein
MSIFRTVTLPMPCPALRTFLLLFVESHRDLGNHCLGRQ